MKLKSRLFINIALTLFITINIGLAQAATKAVPTINFDEGKYYLASSIKTA